MQCSDQDCLVYDPQSNAWLHLAEMNELRVGFGTIQLNELDFCLLGKPAGLAKINPYFRDTRGGSAILLPASLFFKILNRFWSIEANLDEQRKKQR